VRIISTVPIPCQGIVTGFFGRNVLGLMILFGEKRKNKSQTVLPSATKIDEFVKRPIFVKKTKSSK
jgi:hypothetical protein